jgi:hypothetical protein
MEDGRWEMGDGRWEIGNGKLEIGKGDLGGGIWEGLDQGDFGGRLKVIGGVDADREVIEIAGCQISLVRPVSHVCA